MLVGTMFEYPWEPFIENARLSSGCRLFVEPTLHLALNLAIRTGRKVPVDYCGIACGDMTE